MTTSPNSWHRRPKGCSAKRCPICDAPKHCKGEHRLVSKANTLRDATWTGRLPRDPSTEITFGGTPKRQPAKPKTAPKVRTEAAPAPDLTFGTLADYVFDYFAEKEVTKGYHDEVVWMVRRIDAWHGRPVRLNELSEYLIDQWLDTLKARSRNPWFRSIFCTLWRDAYAHGACPQEPPAIRRPRRAKLVKAAKQPPRQGTVITAETRAKLVQAAQLVSQGVTHEAIAERLRIEPHMIRYWQTAHPILWQLAEGTAMEVIRDMVRRLAGTREVFNDPVGYMTAAYAAKRWSRGRNEPLFLQPVEGMTLTRFYHERYYPIFLSGTTIEATAKQYEQALKHWALATGDPPLDQIDDNVMATYRDLLVKCPGPSGRVMSPNSVRSRMRHLFALLRKAGPEGDRNRGAFALISRVPWCKLPRALYRDPKIVPDRHIAAIYHQGADLMSAPEVAGIPPAIWWRAWIVAACYTGLRVRSLVELEWNDVRFEDRRIIIPPERLKTGRGLTIPMPDDLLDHLQAIRGDRQRVFGWTKSLEQLRLLLHEVQDKAGIPRAEHFGMHRIRKTVATKLYAINPLAAQLILGHTKMDMTTMHYVNGQQMMAPALEALPTPFKKGGAQ